MIVSNLYQQRKETDMDWMIDHLGPSLTAGILAAALGLVIFGLLALTPLYSWQTAVVYGLRTGFGTWLGNVIARAFKSIRTQRQNQRRYPVR
jgi:hypothetical protein